MPPLCPGLREGGREPPARPLPTPPRSLLPVQRLLCAQRCSGGGFSSERGPCSSGRFMPSLRVGSGLGHPLSPQPSTRAALGQRGPGESPPVGEGETGVEPPRGLQTGGAWWGAGLGVEVTAQASWSPRLFLFFCSVSVSLRSFPSGQAAGGNQGLAQQPCPGSRTSVLGGLDPAPDSAGY